MDFPIVEQLDEDPAATTYLVRDAAARDAVATVATAPVAAEDRGAFLRWADRLGTVAAHPHVADVLAAGLTADGRPYVVSRTGQVLADQLAASALDPLTARAHGIALAGALATAHGTGLTHGTVQPATVLLDGARAVLAGFSALAPGLTLPFAVGDYTPPEHMATAAVGRAAASEPGDVYGLGVTLYVLLGGVPPWDGEPMNLALRAMPLTAPPRVPDALFEVVRAAASIDPAARPTAPQLRDWLTGLELGAVEQGAPTPVPARLLSGLGSRVVGRRTMVMVAGAGGAAGITGGVLASGASSGGTGASTTTAAGGVGSGAGGTAAGGGGVGSGVGGTAVGGGGVGGTVAGGGGMGGAVGGAAVVGAAAGTAVGLPAASAGVAGTAAAGVTVTKVVVVTVAVAAVGVGGGYTATEILGADCDKVVADRPAREVLVDAANLLGRTSFEFDLALGQVTAAGAVDPAAQAGRFTVRPAEQGGEGRLVDGQLYVTGPIASTPDGEWTVVDTGSMMSGYAMAADLPAVAANLLGTADPVERDGCDFTGTLTGSMPFEASIEDGTGRLTRVAFSAGKSGLAGLATDGERIEATFGAFGTTVDVSSPVTSTPPTEPPSAGLEGRWVGIHGDVQLAIAGGAVGILFQGRELCAGAADTSGTVTTVPLVCPDGTYGNPVATIELDDDGQLLLSGVGIVAGVTLDGIYQRAA